MWITEISLWFGEQLSSVSLCSRKQPRITGGLDYQDFFFFNGVSPPFSGAAGHLSDMNISFFAAQNLKILQRYAKPKFKTYKSTIELQKVKLVNITGATKGG